MVIVGRHMEGEPLDRRLGVTRAEGARCSLAVDEGAPVPAADLMPLPLASVVRDVEHQLEPRFRNEVAERFACQMRQICRSASAS
jgi:hypothetical protein